MSKKNRFISLLLVSLSSVVLLPACDTLSGKETAGQYVDDATITAKIKTEILNAPTLKSYQISVETLKGTVQLSGFVDSQAQKYKAEELAQKVKGVKTVKNNLIVKK